MRLAAEGTLHEVQVLGGAVYLGRIVGDDGAMLRLSDPAVVLQESTPAASQEPAGRRIIVQSLTTDPFGMAADILIPLDTVILIGVVEPTSSLGRAYGEAMGLAQSPAASGVP
jgi:hypothetical protein